VRPLSSETTQHEALTRLAASTAEAVARALEAFVPDGVTRGEVTIVSEDQPAFANLPMGGVAASVRYVDGVTGANVFVMPAESARVLAAAMGVPTTADDAPLTELELSAIGEAANQMLAAASAAISVMIGQQISISPPDVRVIDGRPETLDAWGTAPYACATSFTLAGAPCRLIQLVPSAFVVRVARAIDEQTVEQPNVVNAGETATGAAAVPLTESLGRIKLRLWAELGRTRLPLGAALSVPSGAVLELDQAADSPVELYVNGLRFGTGRLLVTDGGEWAVELLETANGRPDKVQPVATPESPATAADETPATAADETSTAAVAEIATSAATDAELE